MGVLEVTGRTDERLVPALDNAFWTVGRVVRGVVEEIRATPNGNMYRLSLESPVSIDGDSVEEVEMPAATGFRAAHQACAEKAAWARNLRVGDILVITCFKVNAPKKEGYSPRPDFELTVIRNDGK
jgi:hypothetical protein